MPNYRKAAKRAARKYGINPTLFLRQINAESGFNPNAGSHAGAQGIAQFMPATARSQGVNLNDGRVTDDLEGAARLMRSYIQKYGSYENALRAYNAGPGAIEASKGYGETNAYVSKIIKGGNPKGLTSTSDPDPGDTGPTKRSRKVTTTIPGVDRSEDRQLLLQQYLASERGKPDSLLALKAGLDASQDTPSQTKTRTVTEPIGGTARPSQGGSGGSQSAVSYARSKVGESEQGGANRGPFPGWLNQRFGFAGGGQPWCAMFTSVAVTKGGAPKSARTASVAEVRAKAKSKQGYRGFVNPRKAKAGDLILFGNSHIGMVEKVTSKGIVMIAGNDSDRVNRRTVGFGEGDVVRPAYRGSR